MVSWKWCYESQVKSIQTAVILNGDRNKKALVVGCYERVFERSAALLLFPSSTNRCNWKKKRLSSKKESSAVVIMID